MKLYRIYDRTDNRYATNTNRVNGFYTSEDHAKKGLRGYQHLKPAHDFELHVFETVYRYSIPGDRT